MVMNVAFTRLSVMRAFQPLIVMVFALGLLTAMPRARATLGEIYTPAGATAAGAMVGVQRSTTPHGSYTVHAYSLSSGTNVHEYANASGFVFAVTWQGPQIPDLRQLLGTHFDRYAATAAVSRRRAPVVLNDAHLVIHSGGHQRAFSGQVYLPEWMPAGVSERDLQ